MGSVVTVTDTPHVAVAQTIAVQAVDNASLSTPAPAAAAVVREELVFVDRRVDDTQALIDQLLSQTDSTRHFTVIELHTDEDGVDQITQALRRFHDVAAIHILSHGEGGQLTLGGTVLDLTTLNQHAGGIVTWGAHLAQGADILLYGCDLAATASGRALSDQLSLLTGADVAASSDATGDQAQGGDWVLEYTHGQIDTHVALGPQGQATWAHLLGLTPVAAPAAEVIVDSAGTSVTNTNKSVAVAADGRSVAMWMEGGSIYVNRYSSTGVQTGATITVFSGNEPIFAGMGSAAQIAMNDNGDFAVTYAYMNMGVGAPTGDAIRVQRYNADGTANGGMISVAVKVYNAVFLFAEPTIALDNSGHVVVGYYTGVAAVAGAFYDSTGSLVQSVAPGAGSDASAAISENGTAILTWTNGAGVIRGQRYDVASGNTIGGGFDISAGGTSQASSVAMDDQGNIAVAWVSNVNGNNDIFVRRYDASGNALGGVRQANTYTTSDQTAPSVGMDTDGDFIVAWQSNGQDGSGMGIYARQFYSGGGAGLGEQLVNTTTAGAQVAPSAAMVGGVGVVTWSGNAASDILSRRFIVTDNTAPTLGTSGGGLGYTENAAATPIDTGLILGDSDSAEMEGATIQLTGNYANGQDILSFVSQNGITGVWDASTGTLTLSGASSLANYQTALRSVAYRNSSDDPSASTRTVRFRISDGSLWSLGGTRTIAVTPVNDAPTVTTSGGSAVFTENAGPQLVDSGIVLTDPDSSNLVSATVRISANYANGQDALVFVNQNGIAGSWDAATGTLTLSGGATVAQYQAALRSVRYDNSSDTPGVLARTIAFQISDGALPSNTGTRSVTVTAVNDAPVVTASGSILNYTENAGTVLLDSGIALGDGDSTALAGVTVRISANYTNGQDILSFTAQNGITGTWNAASGTLTLSGNASLANYQTALRSIGYSNGSDSPSTAARTVTITATDGSATSASASRTINLNAVNDAPTATISPVSYAVNEQASLVLHGTGLSVADVDAGNSTVRATLSVLSGVLNVNAGSSGVTVSGSGTMAVVLTGTLAQINGLLAGLGGATLSYLNASDAPAASDTLTLLVNDQGNTGSGGALTGSDTAVIHIAAVNDGPTLAANQPASVNRGAILNIAASALRTTDPDNTAAQLVYTVTTIPGGGVLSNNGVAIGLNGSFTQADISAGRLRYAHSGGPGTSDSFTFTVSDGAGGSTGSASFLITVVDVNTPPLVAVNSPLTVAEGATILLDSAHLGSSDADNAAAQLRYTLTGATSHGDLLLNGVAIGLGDAFTQDDIDQGRMRYAHDGSETASDSFVFVLDDGTGGSVPNTTFGIVVTPVDDTPQLTGNLGATVNEGGSVNLNGSDLHISDPDTAASQLRYTVTTAPAQGQLLLNGVVLSTGGIFTQDDVDQGRVRYQHDGGETTQDQLGFSFGQAAGGTAGNSTFTVGIHPVNDAPDITVPLQFAFRPGQALILQGSGWSISDADAGASAITATLQVQSGALLVSTGATSVLAMGSGSNTIVLSGSAAELTALLTGQQGALLSYQGADPFTGDALTITVSDAGTQGASMAQSVQRQVGIQRPSQDDAGGGSGSGIGSPSSPSHDGNNHVPGTPEQDGGPRGAQLALPTVSEPLTEITLLQVNEDAPGAGPDLALSAGAHGGPGLRVIDNQGGAWFPDQTWPYRMLPGISVSYILGLDGTEAGITLYPADLSIDPALHWQSAGIDALVPSFSWVTTEKVQLAALVLSLGSVWWLSRTSSLLGSLLFTVPLWRQIDPLPVLHGGGAQQDEQDGGALSAHPSDRAVRAENMFASARDPESGDTEIA